MIDSNQNESICWRKYWLLIFIIMYNLVNIFISCLYNSVIFDPWQFVWGFLFILAGPLFVIISLILFVKVLIERKKEDFILALSTIICIISVLIWSFGFWSIGSYFRPKVFKLVAEHNEQQVIKAISNMEDPNRVSVSDFRYPYFHMFTFGRYKDGALFLIVPGGPESNDEIIYDPNNIVLKEGWEHLAGPWYYSYAEGR